VNRVHLQEITRRADEGGTGGTGITLEVSQSITRVITLIVTV